MTRTAQAVSRAPTTPDQVPDRVPDRVPDGVPDGVPDQAWDAMRAARTLDDQRTALAGLRVGTPDEAVLSPDDRLALLRHNADALRERGAIDEPMCRRLREAGEAIVRTTDAVIASDGNVFLRHTDLDNAWSWLADARGVARCARGAMANEAGGMHAPVVLCGAAPPTALVELHALVREMDPKHVFTRGLLVLHEDERSLGGALTCADISAVIADRAVTWFLGADVAPRFEAWMRERPDEAVPKRLLHAGVGDGSSPESPTPLSTRVHTTLSEGVRRQAEEYKHLCAQNDALYADETLEDARERLREGALGKRALRVLLCTTRHSSYTRHSAEGLREAFASLGHEARLLIESSDQAVPNAVMYARAVHEFRPELIVMVNYTRQAVDGAIPAHIPFVTWIQDAMHHLQDPALGAAMTGWDVYAGSTMVSLWEECGWRAEAAMPYPVCASSQRFHDGPVEGGLLGKFRCDVAFVSHHSETPEAVFERLTSRFAPDAGRVAELLFADARGIARRAHEVPVGEAIERAIGERFREIVGRAPSVQERTMLRHQVMEPLVGRVFRHESLSMAQRVCARRGWSLRLYGNGWDESPFRVHASGPVAHDTELRACYAGARAHLHLDLNTITHQRVFECALSGGLPVFRAWAGCLSPGEIHAIDELVERGAPSREEEGTRWFHIEPGSLGERLMDERRAMGLPAGDELALPRSLARYMAGHPFFRERTCAPFDPVEVFGGVSDLAFTDESSLERVLERAIEDDAWRAERSDRIRAGVRAHATAEVFARRLLEHTARVFGWRDRTGAPPDMTGVRASYDDWIREGAGG